MIGKTIGQYRIVKQIGEGGMAVVYEAIHIRLKKRVAIKVLNEELIRKTTIRQRFENEARIMAELNHPNIVNIFDYVESSNILAIVMELLEGLSLKDYLKRKGKLDKKESISIFMQVLSAFDLAHQRGIIHRDIKPSNIFIETHNNNNVKILDFGIAKLLSSDHSATHHGAQMGSPLYMSPEQVKDAKDVDNLSDIYSLGVVLYHMLNGSPPISDTTLSRFDIFNKIVYEPTPELRGFPEINKIIQKATQKDKRQRYLTCRDFKDDLVKALESKKENKPEITKIPKNNTENTEIRKKRATKRTDKKKTKPRTTRSRKKQKTKKKSNNLAVIIPLVLILLGGLGYLVFMNQSSNKKTEQKETEKIVKQTPEKKENVVEFTPLDKDIKGDANNLVTKSVVETKDGGYILVGYNYDRKQDDADLWIYKISKKGNKEWGKSMGAGKRDEANAIVTFKNSFIIGGYTKSKGKGKEDIWLIEIDDDGNKKWEKTFGDKNVDKLVAMTVDTKGNLIVAGQKKSRTKGYQAYLLVIDAETGKEKTSAVVGKSKKDKITDVEIIKDKIVFSGSKNNKVWLYITDISLNKEIDKTFNFGNTATAIAIDKNDNICLTGTTKDDKAFFVKMDHQAKSLWDEAVLIGNQGKIEMPKSIITLDSNDNVLAINETDTNTGKGSVRLFKLGNQGNILKKKKIDIDNNSIFVNYINDTKDKGILAVLEVRNNEEYYTKVLKLNQDLQEK